MLKKILSYVWIYIILFNSIYTIFLVDQSFANNDLKLTQPSNKTYNSSDYKNYSTDTLIVKFKNTKSRLNTSSITNTLSSFWKSNIEMLDNINVWLVHFDKPIKDLNKVVSTLKSLNNVEYVEPDYVRNLSYTGVATTDTFSNQQWYLDSINASEAWKMYNDTENKTIVSVNDSGIDYTHLDITWTLKNLSSNCKDDTWNIIVSWCPNNWWNFEWSWSYNPVTSVLAENDIYDINWHGTHVSWIIWAVKNNWRGIVWVTQNSEVFGSRIYSYHKNYALFYVSNTIRALNFAIQNWAKVVNASYGWINFSQAEYDAINVAKNAGVLVIAAAWNSGTNNDWVSPFYPASYDLDNIISVASVWWNDQLASYSNYWANTVDIAAPGWDIWVQDTWILATYPNITEIFSHDMNSFSWITLTWTWLNWNIYSWLAIETQSWAFLWNSTYTWSEDKTLVFNQKFDLSGAKFAKFNWYIECELSAGDNLEVLVNDQVIWTSQNNWTYERAVVFNYIDVELPIPSNLYTSDSELKIRFNSNNDWVQWIIGDLNNYWWCTIDNIKVEKYNTNSNSYAILQWTSMATPLVTWLAAMLWSYKPDLTYSQVKDIILTSKDTIPSLTWKVATTWKINAQKSINELISRYWITKNWEISWNILTLPYINLNWKNVTFNSSVINFNSTWTIISLSWSSILWESDFNIWIWKSIYNNWNNILSTSNDFSIIAKSSTGLLLSNSWTTSWNSLIITYTWTKIGDYNLELHWENYWLLYSWALSTDIPVPINNSFTWGLSAYVYKKWDLSNWISTGITLKVLDSIFLNNLSFNYVWQQTTITWSLSFASGAYTNSTWTILNVTSSVYPVDYQITGDLLNTQTGTLNNTWSINLWLTSWDGVKNINLVLTKSWYTQSQTYTWNIILDKTSPVVNISSHTNNQQVWLSTITLIWSISEANWVSSLLINWTWVTLSWSTFSKNISLVPWNNTITYQATDLAGNVSTGSINIVYQTYNVDNNTWNTNNTGSLLFLGNNTSSTWTIFNSTGSITINSSTWSHRVVLSLSWLTITSSSWDGIFNPPSQISFSGTFNNSWYTHIPSLTFDIWSHNTELNLTWTTAQVNLFVGTSQNWRTLSIFRSTNNWVSYSLLTTCLVSSGICSFYTDKFSLFTLATSGSSSSSSSSSNSSSNSIWWTSLWWTMSSISTCIDTQLECRTITTGTWNTNKWYKKEWVTCEWWNLWKVCSIDNITQSPLKSNYNIKKHKPVKDLLEWYIFKSKAIEKIFKQKSLNLIKIDDDLSNIVYLSSGMDNYREEYRTLYTKLVESAKKLDDLLSKKDAKAYQEEYKKFLSINTSLNNYKTDLNISFVQVWLDKIYYLKYKNTRINKMQSDLFKRINKKQANTYIYRLANKVTYNLNELLTNKVLTKEEIQIIRADTINTYKEFILQSKKLAKK